MIDRTDTPQAVREAVQPSLWDRLLDELHDLGAEASALRTDLAGVLDGEAAVEALLAGGARAIAAEPRLDDDARRKAHRLGLIVQRQCELEEGNVMVTADVVREAVRRDLEELFGIERLQARFLWTDAERGEAEDTEDVLSKYPHVMRSVLNYGVPSFSGRRAGDFDLEALGRELREVVAVFEPRLKRDSIRVTVDGGAKDGLKVRIDGVLMLSPVSERMRLSTTINLDNGSADTRIEDA
ncbi:MAG: GPW/gp25 family protein [Paracoccaceae bacterium]